MEWFQAGPLFQSARRFGDTASYVYFIGEGDDGPVKIGSAKDPITRLRQMQTGNSRRLKVEYVLLGDAFLERLLHEQWEHLAIRTARAKDKPHLPPGTEWFEPQIREALFPVIATAAEGQIRVLDESPGDVAADDLERPVRLAHAEHGIVLTPRDQVHLLGRHGGYVLQSRRSRI